MADASARTSKLKMGEGWGIRLELETLSLRVEDGPDAGLQNVFFLPLIRIGSSRENDVVLSDSSVSRFHAEIVSGEDGPHIRDLGSTNGTRLNGVKITEALLEPGMELTVGETRLVVQPRTETRVGMVGERKGLGELVGGSETMRELYGLLEAIAPTQASVLILGESGTGKELVARTLHDLSGREGPLVVYDAGTSDPEFMRSDLFGHEKGAFTGAAEARDGAFRTARGGTVFIDEIGELPLDLQPRLLRVLESREVTPVGSDKKVKIDVRVLAATHRDLEAMVEAGEFREDLYHRLAVIEAPVPPLRERAEDLETLVEHLTTGLGQSLEISDEAWEALRAHSWPGNVRELRNVLERVSATCRGRAVKPEDLKLRKGTTGTMAAVSASGNLGDVERETILATLERNGGNRSKTAKELGISTTTLWRRLKSYGVAD